MGNVVDKNSVDYYLSLLTKRENVLDLMKKLKSPFAKKDRYKQLSKLNKEIERWERHNGY